MIPIVKVVSGSEHRGEIGSVIGAYYTNGTRRCLVAFNNKFDAVSSKNLRFEYYTDGINKFDYLGKLIDSEEEITDNTK